jgi:hypothetical protein
MIFLPVTGEPRYQIALAEDMLIEVPAGGVGS